MATVEQGKEFSFDHKSYFQRFLCHDPLSKTVRHAVEYFVDDLRRDRLQTIERYLNEPNIEEIFRALARLLLSEDDR